MGMAKESMAKSLREIANALESEEVEPRIFREVEIFIRIYGRSVDLPWRQAHQVCPPEILEEILQYLNPKDLKSAVLVNKKLCVIGSKPKFWSKSKVSLQFLDTGVGFLTSESEV